jgi:hypothetical protein
MLRDARSQLNLSQVEGYLQLYVQDEDLPDPPCLQEEQSVKGAD